MLRPRQQDYQCLRALPGDGVIGDIFHQLPVSRMACGSANTAENTSASITPCATVTPMACNTGTHENASRPKPSPVAKLAKSKEAKVRGAQARSEQGRVGKERDNT